jgi:hypothetical protein
MTSRLVNDVYNYTPSSFKSTLSLPALFITTFDCIVTLSAPMGRAVQSLAWAACPAAPGTTPLGQGAGVRCKPAGQDHGRPNNELVRYLVALSPKMRMTY